MHVHRSLQPPPSRLAPARRRARLLKVASAGAAVAGFGVLSLLVRGGAHTATAPRPQPRPPRTSGALAALVADQPGSGRRAARSSARDSARAPAPSRRASRPVLPRPRPTPHEPATLQGDGLRDRRRRRHASPSRPPSSASSRRSRRRSAASGPTSDLERLNRSPAETVIVSPLLATALDDALRAAAGDRRPLRPDDRRRARVGGLRPHVRRDRARPARRGCPRRPLARDPALRPPRPRPAGLRLDLNGVVKGRAVDDALALLEGDGFVSAGGDLATRGELVVALPAGGTVTLHSGALATSGIDDAVVASRRRRPRPPPDRSRNRRSRPTFAGSASPSAPRTCLAADVAAKTAFLLGDDGPAWLERQGLQGRFVAETEIVLAGGWPESTESPVCIS